MDNKSKSRQRALHQTYKLLCIKGHNQQNEEATHEMGENICKSIYYFNFGKGLEQTCSKDDTKMACKHMKDASNTNHQKCKSKPQ